MPSAGAAAKFPLVIRSLVDNRRNVVCGGGLDRRRELIGFLHKLLAGPSTAHAQGLEVVQEAVATRAALALALRDLRRRRPRLPTLIPGFAQPLFAETAAMADALNRASRKLSGRVYGRRNSARPETSGLRVPLARVELRRRLGTARFQPSFEPIEVGWILRYYGLATTRHTGTERIYEVDYGRLERLHQARVLHDGIDFVGLEDVRRTLVSLASAHARNIAVDWEDDDSRRIFARG